MAGRPRKPTALLELNGAFKHNPDRARPNEPKELRPLGDPPARLPIEVLPFWREIVDMVIGGVLTYRDRWCVELAARLMWKSTHAIPAEAILELARAGELGTDVIKAMVARETISSSEQATLNRLLASMGMTPADRSKLSVPQEKPKNQFADLAGSRPN